MSAHLFVLYHNPQQTMAHNTYPAHMDVTEASCYCCVCHRQRYYHLPKQFLGFSERLRIKSSWDLTIFCSLVFILLCTDYLWGSSRQVVLYFEVFNKWPLMAILKKMGRGDKEGEESLNKTSISDAHKYLQILI